MNRDEWKQLVRGEAQMWPTRKNATPHGTPKSLILRTDTVVRALQSLVSITGSNKGGQK